ncbi:MAG: hypothetical protein V4613_09615 [Bacteroidota bacterium]
MKWICTIAFVLFFTQVRAIQIEAFDTIHVQKNSKFSTDNLGNIFVISPTNDIEKYDKNGLKTATANFKVLGNITSIDASNPFEIYVFYRDQNKILYLDNLLNLRGETDLESIGVSQCAAVARSFDNQIWLFDMGDLKLKKYSKELKFISESASLNSFISDSPIFPDMLIDINSSLYLLNNGAILNFDAFINYTKTMLSDSITNFQVVNGQILYLRKDSVIIYNPTVFKFETLPINFSGKIKNIRIEKERLYILADENLILHTYSEK